MNFSVQIGRWDIILVLTVSVQCTAIAYLHAPKWKALALSVPIPFTMASLALDKPLDVTHVTGLMVLLAYTHAVRFLHYQARVPIVPAIVISAVGYCTVGAGLASILPRTGLAFWLAAALAFTIALVLYMTTPHREEPGHRSPLPLWVKLPIIAGVIMAIVAVKQVLRGFMTVFPMVGVITAYEARHSLWTICRQIPVIMLGLVPMMAAVRLSQDAFGLGPGLLLGWGVFVTVLVPLTWSMWFAPGKQSDIIEEQT